MTVDSAWDVIPDQTSLVIVESAGWPDYTETPQLSTSDFNTEFEVSLAVPNLADTTVLVGGWLVDNDGSTTTDSLAVYRIIYVWGQPPSVRVIGPDANDPATGQSWQMDVTDETLRCDTTANDINLELLPIAQYEGRTLMIWNDGANIVHVACAPGDQLFDGNSTIDLTCYGNFLKVTAGSNVVQALPSVRARRPFNMHSRGYRHVYSRKKQLAV